MQKVLRRRILRDLRANKFRYLALAVLIIMSMYLVVSLVGASETIMQGGAASDREHKVEDGQFSVFVPLTASEKNEITQKGLSLEENCAAGISKPAEDQSCRCPGRAACKG